MVAFEGNRCLLSKEAVWDHNSWDNVPWCPEQLQQAKNIVAAHKANGDSANCDPWLSSKWDKFYTNNSRNFFKDRNWYEHELSSLFQSPGSEPYHILEIGCGSGSSIFPLLSGTCNSVFIDACDFSPVAVGLVQSDERFDPKRCNVFCHDISDACTPLPIQNESVDLVLMVFVLSAIPRKLMEVAIEKALKTLKPGGRIFVRDYGLYDLAQLRMPSGNWIQGHQYKRGDNTLTYFFTTDELSDLVLKNPNYPMQIQEVKEDRRLLVNRKRQLQMYRVWIQGIFYKL